MPEVSVIIPMHNARETIERAIASAAYQDVDSEIIIVDDGSTDGSAEHVQTFSKRYTENIILLRTDHVLGVSGARNLAISRASSPFIAFLDADDLWLRGKLRKQLDLIKSSDDIVIVSCDCYKISPDGLILGRSHKRHSPATGAYAWKTLLSYNFMPTPSVLTHTELVRKAGGFREDLVVAEDLDLWIRLGRQGRIEVIKEVLVHYFDYQGSLMKRSGRDSTFLVLDMIRDHIEETKIPQVEQRSIIAARYFELGKHSLGYGDLKTMDICFSKARDSGFSSSKLLMFRSRQWFKRLLRIGERFR